MTLVVQEEPTPEQLARQCQEGCRASFERLVEMYTPRIFGFILQRTRNSHDAEDLTQETFMRAYRSIDRFQTTHSFAAWLFTIARYSTLNAKNAWIDIPS